MSDSREQWGTPKGSLRERRSEGTVVFSCKGRKRKDYQGITKTHGLKVRKLRLLMGCSLI